MALPTHDELLAQLEHDPAAAGSTSVSGECPICYEKIESSFTTSCNHTFCRQCLKHWLRTSTTCPNCRAALCRRSSSLYLQLALQGYRHYELDEDFFSPGNLFPILDLSTTIDYEFIAAAAEHGEQDLRLRAAADAPQIEQERGARRLEAAFYNEEIQNDIAQTRARWAEEGRLGLVDIARGEEPRLFQARPPIAREQRRDPQSMVPRHQGGGRGGGRRGR
ncbi:hypothetical protein AC578_1514 [Pseudocercospora eumusae]|uniref:RING-type domain-containing protein n=1 Tax=Pseudocercospora eumusae TaxID=321146 RepID=A0A139GVF9_9PEZI|nr:hypothetical protein AC578_1514 [Pseudocercospora eumusae]